jgi:hypothetical protein
MDAIRQMYEDNLKRMGLDDPAPEAQPAPARRAVAPHTAPVQAVRPLQPESSEDHIQQLERFAANAQERLYKVEHTGVSDPRIDELAARVKVLENLLRPVLAARQFAEIEKIELEYARLTEQGKTNGLNYHQYRTLKRTARQALLREAASQ